MLAHVLDEVEGLRAGLAAALPVQVVSPEAADDRHERDGHRGNPDGDHAPVERRGDQHGEPADDREDVGDQRDRTSGPGRREGSRGHRYTMHSRFGQPV